LDAADASQVRTSVGAPVEELQVESMVMKCNNNRALEVEIPKVKANVDYRN